MTRAADKGCIFPGSRPARARAMVPMATQIAPQPFSLSPRSLLYGGISSSPGRSNPKSHNLRRGPRPPPGRPSPAGVRSLPGDPRAAALAQAQSATWRPRVARVGVSGSRQPEPESPGRRAVAGVLSSRRWTLPEAGALFCHCCVPRAGLMHGRCSLSVS